MQINISKKQYWDLMRSVYMADWMANAICESDMKKDEGIEMIRDHIFSFAKEMGYEKFVDNDIESKEYYSTSDLDDEPSIRQLIERYDENSAWEEFAGWLGERDFLRKYSIDEIQKMSQEGRFLKHMDCQIIWEEEFEKHGIEHVKLDILDNSLKRWHTIKEKLIQGGKKEIFFHEREVWWCSLGKNVGFEQNGKGDEFTRPIIIVKRLSLDTCLIVPLTTSKKRKNLFPLGLIAGEKEDSYAMVEQIRLIDAKRLGMKIGVLGNDIYVELIKFIRETNFGG